MLQSPIRPAANPDRKRGVDHELAGSHLHTCWDRHEIEWSVRLGGRGRKKYRTDGQDDSNSPQGCSPGLTALVRLVKVHAVADVTAAFDAMCATDLLGQIGCLCRLTFSMRTRGLTGSTWDLLLSQCCVGSEGYHQFRGPRTCAMTATSGVGGFCPPSNAPTSFVGSSARSPAYHDRSP